MHFSGGTIFTNEPDDDGDGDIDTPTLCWNLRCHD
jgi:hypothetical protein